MIVSENNENRKAYNVCVFTASGRSLLTAFNKAPTHAVNLNLFTLPLTVYGASK